MCGYPAYVNYFGIRNRAIFLVFQIIMLQQLTYEINKHSSQKSSKKKDLKYQGETNIYSKKNNSMYLIGASISTCYIVDDLM